MTRKQDAIKRMVEENRTRNQETRERHRKYGGKLHYSPWFDYYAWPGGYPLFYVTEDNGVLCPRCANKNRRLCLSPDDPQWHVVDYDINYEDEDLYCDNCSQPIECAYPSE